MSKSAVLSMYILMCSLYKLGYDVTSVPNRES